MRLTTIALPFVAVLLSGCFLNRPEVSTTGSLAHSSPTYRLQFANVPADVQQAAAEAARLELATRGFKEDANGDTLIRVDFAVKPGKRIANAYVAPGENGMMSVKGFYTRTMVLTALRSRDQGFLWQARVVQEDPHDSSAELAPDLVRAAFASR